MNRASSERVQAVVIGGGVVGCAVLRELAQRGVEALLLEAEPSLCEGTSKANSAIVHTGFDARPGTTEAAMLRRAAALWPAVIEELGVPFLEVGALMLARDASETSRLRTEVAANATALGVETELLGRDELREVAPFVSDGAVAALSVPAEAVIDPFWLTRRYAEAGIVGGARVRTDAPVVGLEVGPRGVTVHTQGGGSVVADQVFNCAGLWADAVAVLAGDDSFSLRPRRGQFLVSEETFGVDRIVLPLPGPMGKGMLVTPIVFGGVLLGPTAEDCADKQDRSVDPESRSRILEACRALVPEVAEMIPIRQFSGLRAVSSTGDYILRPATSGDRLYHVTGIRSTGVSTSPAVAEQVVDEASRLRGWQRRASPARVAEPTFVEAAGELVCLCRSVSRGELVGAVHGVVGATTLDAAKRACGVTFGDCQGNLCAVDVVERIAKETGRTADQVLKHRAGSWLLAPGGRGDTRRRPAGGRPNTVGALDLVVVGGGLAGIGAGLAAIEAGMRVLVVERRHRWGGALGSWPAGLEDDERRALETFVAQVAAGELSGWLEATVAGLLPANDGWAIQVQAATGGIELQARSVVLATGGYVEPREHLPIGGPRGSGLVTADFIEAALDAGWLPGRRAIVVGRGRTAEHSTHRLREAGVAVNHVAIADPSVVQAVRGDRRLEAALVAGDWIAADTLVLAHRLLPAGFLLRSLGLLDGRPGIAPPAGRDGQTELAGLWVAGTCRRPDIDHRGSLADGRLVTAALSSGAGVVQ